MHAKDNQGNCYYDTAYGHKHSAIGDRDLMREFSVACRAVGMTVLYYVQTSRERRGALVASYAARNADGSAVVRTSPAQMLPAKEEGPVICLIGPAREYIKNVVRELAENYDFDGYWLDGFGWFGRTMICYCETCRGLYREDRGAELPPRVDKGDEAFRQYYRWRQTMNRRALHEIIAAIRAVNAELTVTHNGSGFQVWADGFANDADDYLTREFHYQEGYGGLALWCRMQDAFTPDRPYEIETWRFFNTGGNGAPTGDADQHAAPAVSGPGTAHMVRDYQVKPVPMLFSEMATITANGGFVQYYDQVRPDGRLDQLSLDRMQAAFDQVREREPWLPDAAAGQRRVHYADLVWSKRTQDFAPAAHGQGHAAGLEGAHEALLASRVLHGVVTERRVAEAAIGTPSVLVLSNLVCMDDAVADRLRAFVAAGGGLVATYRTSLADAMGRPARQLPARRPVRLRLPGADAVHLQLHALRRRRPAHCRPGAGLADQPVAQLAAQGSFARRRRGPRRHRQPGARHDDGPPAAGDHPLSRRGHQPLRRRAGALLPAAACPRLPRLRPSRLPHAAGQRRTLGRRRGAAGRGGLPGDGGGGALGGAGGSARRRVPLPAPDQPHAGRSGAHQGERDQRGDPGLRAGGSHPASRSAGR